MSKYVTMERSSTACETNTQTQTQTHTLQYYIIIYNNIYIYIPVVPHKAVAEVLRRVAGWVAGGCWDDEIDSCQWIIPEKSPRGGSFKNRKPIGEVGCCESGMAERSHSWIER